MVRPHYLEPLPKPAAVFNTRLASARVGLQISNRYGDGRETERVQNRDWGDATERNASVFITNVIFWRPPGNRTPTEAETLMCLPFVLRTIELQKPDFIVCLGATPAQRLTGRTDGILKLRGKWLAANVSGQNIPLLPTLHPAYLLRQPNQKRLAWRDLLTLRKMLDGI